MAGTVVIGGGTGFIGSALASHLKNIGYNVISISRKSKIGNITWDDLKKNGLPNDCTAVINVAGQNVLDPTRRWTNGFQQNVYASRIFTTRMLNDSILMAKNKPKVFATISGVGYYPPSETAEYDEDSQGGDSDYFSKLCKEWEIANNLPKELNVRRVIVRSGVVLGCNGGMIKQLYWPFYFGLGGPVGSGKQFMPWIHIEDIVGIFTHAVSNDRVQGVLNGVAPQTITNGEFSTAFAKAMWRPSILPMPVFALNLAFNKERAIIMTEGQKVIPKRTLESGYKYKYADINSAVKECVG